MPKFPSLPLSILAFLLAQTQPSQAQSADPAKSSNSAPSPSSAKPNANAAAAPTDPNAQAPAKPATKAQVALDAAIAKIRNLKSVSADIAMKGKVLNVDFQLDGKYLRAPDNRIRFQLTLSGAGDASGSILQVCDGDILWDVQQVQQNRRFTKVQVDKILKKLDDPGIEPQIRESVRKQMGFAGPEALLVGLQSVIQFDQYEETSLNGIPVLIVRGLWSDRSKLTGPDGQPLTAMGPLPPFVPSATSVWLDKETGWPYRVEMQGQKRPALMRADSSRKADLLGKAAGTPPPIREDNVQPSSLVMVFGNVKLNQEIPIEEFAFQAPKQPGGDDPAVDMTNEYLAILDRNIQERAAREKLGAAKTQPSETKPDAAPAKP